MVRYTASTKPTSEETGNPPPYLLRNGEMTKKSIKENTQIFKNTLIFITFYFRLSATQFINHCCRPRDVAAIDDLSFPVDHQHRRISRYPEVFRQILIGGNNHRKCVAFFADNLKSLARFIIGNGLIDRQQPYRRVILEFIVSCLDLRKCFETSSASREPEIH